MAIGIVGTSVAASRAGSSIFPDVPVGSYYDSAIGEMYGLGIITGFGDGTFRPNDGLTRGQAAVLMQRLRNEVLGIEVSSSSSSSTRSRRTTTSSSSSTSTSSSSSAATTANENGKFRFTTNAYSLDEDADSINVSVVRTGGKEGMVTVDYALVDATATGGDDYELQQGTLVFQANESSKSFGVKLLNDDDQEGDETFTMELSNATGGAEIIEPQTSTFTIKDDEATSSSSSTAAGTGDGTFQYSALMFTANETWSDITIYVQRLGGSTGAASVSYSMTDGTAQSGKNYTKTSGTLNFADGETEKSFTIGLEHDTDITGSKTVNLTLSAPTGGAALHTEYKNSVLTISDDEVGTFGSGAFRFSDNEYDVLESEGFIEIGVIRQSGAQGQATVQYRTSDGTARMNDDYKEAEGTLTFRNGESKKVFKVEVIKDTLTDGGESVNLNLQNASNAGIATPNIATLWIY